MGNIYLVGFMGTGKTAVGRELAEIKGWRFIDLDDLIEDSQHKSVPEIFAKSGEVYFRELEKDALSGISRKSDCVVSCGGGIVLDQGNIDVMRSTGVMVCLSASVDEIIRRTRGRVHRPLLNVPDPKEKVEYLLKVRAPYYDRADIIIDTTQVPIDEIAKKILSAIADKK
ncbi:MAG: shikimate kinase [Candidatus Omnitrophica bacterium]|jgi:shikimate kinase|nr:shikimate kinase [Candidatus Omnitrophota bacterium]MDD5079331.1 shikimate kinase [Candidatus Omnitrophota bacterium]